MNKTVKMLTVGYLGFLVFLGIVYGATSITFHQNPVVPTSEGIEVYASDGTTQIAQGSDQTSIWTWDSANSRFTATIKVKNTGNTNIKISIAFANLSPGWTGSTSGSLTNITPNEMRSVVLYAANPSALGGESASNFSVTVSKE